MKRIVSWAAIILLAFSTYLNVFLSLGETDSEAAAGKTTMATPTEKKASVADPSTEENEMSRFIHKSAR